LRRNEKAALDAILARAREGDLDARAHAQTAYRLYLSRESYLSICVGIRERPPDESPPALEEPMTIEEEAGSILEAEMAYDLHALRVFYEAVHTEK
jgi:hypothetical protein